LAAIYFGVFQGVMPLLGYLGGQGVLGWVEAYAPWIAFALLLFIGGKMIYEAMSEGIEEDIAQITQRVMLMLAIATSIDAMAAGFALTVLDVNPFISCLMIAVTTAVFSFAGVYIGDKSGTWLESKAELLGGVVLILIGFKMLM
jgi:putative Mn2+ efflux pump MntP